MLPLDAETLANMFSDQQVERQIEVRQHPHVVFPPAFAPRLARRIDGSENAATVAAEAYDIANYLYDLAEQYATIGLGVTANDPTLRDHFNRIRPFKDLFSHPRRFRWTLENVAQELRRHIKTIHEREDVA